MAHQAADALTPAAEDPHGASAQLRAQAYVVAGCALVIGLLVTSFMQATSGFSALRQIELASQRSDHLDMLHKVLLDMETGTRGYLLTFEPKFLGPYYSATPQVPPILAMIDRDYEGDGANRAEAHTLVTYARGVADSLTIMANQAQQQGLPNRQGWLDHDRLLMDSYRAVHQQLKNKLLAANQRYIRASIHNFQYARAATVLLAIAAGLLLLLAMRLNGLHRALRDEMSRMLHTEKEQLEREVRVRTEELANLATYLTNVREEEKLHLARELHDEMGALLTAAKLDANWLERKLGAEGHNVERLVRLQQSLTAGITLKRRITNDLRPALLYDLGLIEALRLLAEEFLQGEGTSLEVDLPEEVLQLSDAVSLNLFRITQEAFTNIRKYARAGHASLTLRANPATIELIIRDDGVGFDPESRKIARHGLAGIKHRVYTLAGKLDIRSAPGRGTTIHVLVPR